MEPQPHRLNLERVEQAAATIDSIFQNTPQFVPESLSRELDVRLTIKVETLNPVGSFKGRGADFLISQAGKGTNFVCASAGNFGQAMAYACRSRGATLQVYASIAANPLKIERMRMFGAEVIQEGADFDEAKANARNAVKGSGARYVEDSLDIETLEGAGTMGVELLKVTTPFDALVVAVGNGAMFNGVARVVKAASPQTRMIAVQAEGASAMIESWRAQKMIVHDRVNTIADGIAVRVPIPEALEDMRGLVDDTVLVRDQDIISAMRLLHQHVGLVIEPSGAVGVAAVVANPEKFRGQHVGVILSGGNLTPEQRRQWL
jgi:threonine dehydratase